MLRPTIPAANDLTVQLDADHWRLYNGHGDGQALVEASPDGLSYGGAFAAARRLSPDGRLTADAITMVVVGWAVEDSSWHLGVLLSPELAQSRGGRWCGLARWDNSERSDAEQAGQALSATLGKPFRLVPPPEEETAAVLEDEAPAEVESVPAETSAVAEALPEVPLMPLPLSVGTWVLREEPGGLSWARASNWRTETLLRAAFFAVLTPVFGFLSLGSLLSLYAQVQPQWLPLIGLGLTAIMLLNAVNLFRRLLQSPVTLIDRRQRILKQTARWRKVLQSPFEGLTYVLLSYITTHRKQSALDKDELGIEAWLNVYSPRRSFINLCNAESTDGQIQPELTLKTRELINLREIDTPAHHAALWIAREIGIPAYNEED